MKNLLLVVAFMLSVGAFAQTKNSGGTVPVLPYCETVYNFKPTCPLPNAPIAVTYEISVCHALVASTPPAQYEQVLGDLVDNYMCIHGQWPSWVTIQKIKWPFVEWEPSNKN